MDASPPSTTLAALIPIPAEVTPAEGAFQLTAETHILVDAGDGELSRVAEYLAMRLRPVTGFPLPVIANLNSQRGPSSILLTRKDAPADQGTEGHALTILPEGVTLRASHPAGAFYAVQTLRQLLPASIEQATPQPGPWALPCAQLRDQPRFAWRGLMLDVSRHFFDTQTVKQVIDWMAAYKLNRLHLHLTDDQGWRIEIQSWPRLTSIGGSTQVGGGQGGYYTQAEYAELVAYAQSRCLTLVPEVDLPGHTNAALASYPELNCDGSAPDLYTGMGVGFSSLCIRKEITYQFVEDVIRELAALTTGDYLHIGGDEAHTTSPEDYLYFIGRVQELVHKYGKIAVGWGEVARARLMPQALVQPWHPGNDPASALAQGAQLILSPANRIYLDMKYDQDTALGLNWAGYVNTRSAYDWNPAMLLPGVPEQAIRGIEGPLWTETLQSLEDIGVMIFPRLAGLAETAWSPEHLRNWETYRTRLGAHALRWRAMGIPFYPDPAVPWE